MTGSASSSALTCTRGATCARGVWRAALLAVGMVVVALDAGLGCGFRYIGSCRRVRLRGGVWGDRYGLVGQR